LRSGEHWRKKWTLGQGAATLLSRYGPTLRIAARRTRTTFSAYRAFVRKEEAVSVVLEFQKAILSPKAWQILLPDTTSLILSLIARINQWPV
jgi:hypothetical protein